MNPLTERVVARFLQRADLEPPLGYPGGPCQVTEGWAHGTNFQWVDPKLGLSVVVRPSGPSALMLVTTFWKGEADPRAPGTCPSAERVATKYLERTGGFIPDKFWRAQKAELRKLLLTEIPENRRRPDDVSYMLMDKVYPFFKHFHEALLAFGMHRFAEQSLKDRIEGIQKQIEDFAKSYDTFSSALRDYPHPIATIEDEVVSAISTQMLTAFEEKVKNLRDALNGKWEIDPRTIRSLAQRWVKKAPPDVVKALEEEVASPDHIPSNDVIRVKWHWLKNMGLDRVHPLRDTKRTKLDPLKWVDFLQDVFGTVYAEPEAFTEFDLNGVKVVVDDSTVDQMDIKRYVHYFDKAHALLKAKHLDKVWYGTFFIRCKDCGGENPNDPAAGTGGDYPIGPDVVNIYNRPSDFVVELIAHELGHRYWFKYMNEGQRGKFESLVRVKSDAPVKMDVRQKQDFEQTIKDARQALGEFIDFLPKTLKKLTSAFDKAEKFIPTGGALATPNDEIAQELQGLERPITSWVSFPGAPNPQGFKHHLFEDKLRTEFQAADKARDELLAHLEATNKIPGTQEWDPSRAPEGLREMRKWIDESWRLQAAYLDAMRHYLDAMERLSQRQIDPNDNRPVPSVSTYGASNIDEAFAEVFAHYVIGYDMSRDQLESFRSVLSSTAQQVVERFLTGSKVRRMLPDVMNHFL